MIKFFFNHLNGFWIFDVIRFLIVRSLLVIKHVWFVFITFIFIAFLFLYHKRIIAFIPLIVSLFKLDFSIFSYKSILTFCFIHVEAQEYFHIKVFFTLDIYFNLK
jgi:hypothetical protein